MNADPIKGESTTPGAHSADPGRTASKPFHFNTSAHLLRIGRERATTLSELLHGLRICSENSVFQHTFRTLEEHHFIREGFSNDFAHWAFSACNEPGLSEQLARIDVREFTSIEAVRESFLRTVEMYLQKASYAAERVAHAPFYFCESDTIVQATQFVAHNLVEFLDGMAQVSVHSIHHHFIEARLRLKLASNDFSLWLADAVDMKDASRRLNNIDIYTATMEDVRRQIITIVRPALER
jgi:hypothetical protein